MSATDPLRTLRTAAYLMRMSEIVDTRYELVRGDGPDGGFVELWDRTLAPGGLALEALQPGEGPAVLTGHGISVPLEVAEAFLLAARGYLLR